jgi:hypothetical protein
MPDERISTEPRMLPGSPRSGASNDTVVEQALAVLEDESRAWTDLQHRKYARRLASDPDAGHVQ